MKKHWQGLVCYGILVIMENEIITINNPGEMQLVKETKLQEFFEKFFLFIDVKPKSVETYKKALKQFLAYLSFNGITQPTREDIIKFRDYLEPTHKANTIRLYLTLRPKLLRFRRAALALSVMYSKYCLWSFSPFRARTSKVLLNAHLRTANVPVPSQRLSFGSTYAQ